MSRHFCDFVSTARHPAVQKQPFKAIIRQREYAHDTAVVTIRYADKTAPQYRSGEAVTLKWGWLPDEVQYFYGYVHHVKAGRVINQAKSIDVYLVGASWRMKDKRTHTPYGKLPNLGLLIARNHKFSLSTAADPNPARLFVQGNRSDFDLLVDEAKRIGWTFFVNRTDIFLAPRLTAPLVRNQIPFVFRESEYFSRNSVYEIDQNIGENVPGTDRRVREAYGVDDAGNTFHVVDTSSLDNFGGRKVPGTPLLRDLFADPVRDATEAKARLAGAVQQNRMLYTAKAVLSGNANVTQGRTLLLSGLDDDSDGPWYVTSVDHVLTLEGYQLQADLVRDSLGNPNDPVNTSVTGNPEVLGDCEVGVDYQASAVEPTVYDPLDACTPLEELVSTPTGELVSAPTQATKAGARSPWRAVQQQRLVVPTRQRGVSSKPVLKKATPKVNVWRARTTTVRAR